MPGRFYNGTDYRYGFNGKEIDKCMGEGLQDYGMRIYDNRLGRFLSKDPLAKQYPELTPYQFASNRPIDGIDLDGLEFLDADDAMVEFVAGKLQIKIANFTILNRNTFLRANEDPKNWPHDNNGNLLGIGIDKTITSFYIISPQKQNAEFKDMPNQPSSLKGYGEGFKAIGVDRSARRDIELRGKAVTDRPASSGMMTMGKVGVILDGISFAFEQYAIWSWVYDKELTSEHTKIAERITQITTEAIEKDLIPPKYQNLQD